MLAVALIVCGYLLGSIPFGLVLARWRTGVDVRDTGSGNIGAANVARLAGKMIGIAVFALDALKGVVPTLAARLLFPSDPVLHVETGGAAILGHCFPLWLHFRGGKGVATTFGVLAVVLPRATLAAVVVFTTIVLSVRVVSVASILGAAAACIAAWKEDGPIVYDWLAFAATGLIVLRHRGNVVRLVRRQERRL